MKKTLVSLIESILVFKNKQEQKQVGLLKTLIQSSQRYSKQKDRYGILWTPPPQFMFLFACAFLMFFSCNCERLINEMFSVL